MSSIIDWFVSNMVIFENLFKNDLCVFSGVISISWYPPQHEKTSETSVDSMIPGYLDSAAEYGLKVIPNSAICTHTERFVFLLLLSLVVYTYTIPQYY